MRAPATSLTRAIALPALLLCAAACTGSDAAPAVRRDAGDSVVGTWRVVRYWERGGDSTARRFPFGESPQGYIVYDRTGHVFVHVRRPLPPPPHGASVESASAGELREILSSYAGSFGTYGENRAAGLITHRIEGEVPPLSGTLERVTPFRIDGDTLTIGAGTARQWVLVRVPARP